MLVSSRKAVDVLISVFISQWYRFEWATSHTFAVTLHLFIMDFCTLLSSHIVNIRRGKRRGECAIINRSYTQTVGLGRSGYPGTQPFTEKTPALSEKRSTGGPPSVDYTGNVDCLPAYSIWSLSQQQENVQHFNLHSFALDGLEHVNLMFLFM